MNRHSKHILFLTQVLPYPLVGGARIRAYYVLRYLAQYHRVTLVSFVRPDDRPEHVDHLRQFCHAVHTVPMQRSRWLDGVAALVSLLTGRPIVIVRDWLPAMASQLARLVQAAPFDVVHADQTAMAQYALYAAGQHPAGRRPRLLLDAHNALYLLVQRQATYTRNRFLRLVWQREARRLAVYEAGLCRQFDHILTVTAEDRQALLWLLPAREAEQRQSQFTALPICVDPDGQRLLPRQPDGRRILHLGTMFWPPNVDGVLWFAREVLPLVLQQAPDARFVIAGKRPPPAVQALAAPDSPLAGHVEVTGFVPDPRPLLSGSSLFVVPVRAGGGMRVKIIDAWQWGLPLVSTRIGAEGIETRPGENILLADEPETFARAVVRLLDEPELAETLRQNGRRWVEQRYDWRQRYRALDALYR